MVQCGYLSMAAAWLLVQHTWLLCSKEDRHVLYKQQDPINNRCTLEVALYGMCLFGGWIPRSCLVSHDWKGQLHLVLEEAAIMTLHSCAPCIVPNLAGHQIIHTAKGSVI